MATSPQVLAGSTSGGQVGTGISLGSAPPEVTDPSGLEPVAAFGLGAAGVDTELSVDAAGYQVNPILLLGIFREMKLNNMLVYALITGGTFTESLDQLRQDIEATDPYDLVQLG